MDCRVLTRLRLYCLLLQLLLHLLDVLIHDLYDLFVFFRELHVALIDPLPVLEMQVRSVLGVEKIVRRPELRHGRCRFASHF